jgi:hypothetical protein
MVDCHIHDAPLGYRLDMLEARFELVPDGAR